MGPGRRSVQPGHQRTPKAAVPWGGSFCFPLMAPPVTPERDVTAILVASQQVCASHVPDLRELGPDLRQARQELSIDISNYIL